MEKFSAYLLAGSGPGEAARLLTCTTKWTDDWLGNMPSICIDILLSNVAIADSISLRLGLDILDNDIGCPFYMQALDTLGHHSMTYMAGGYRTRMHYTLYDMVFRVAREAGTWPKFEPGGLLPNAEGRRPTDILLVTIPLLKQNEWQRFLQIALDFTLVSPFTAVAIGRQFPNPASVAAIYAEIKRQDKGIFAGISYETIWFRTNYIRDNWRDTSRGRIAF